MTDKDLIAKLSGLKQVGPDKAWLEGNRDLLLSQISNSGAHEIGAWQSFVISLSSFAKAASKPAYALGAFILVLGSLGLYGHEVFGTAKPNDSLYIARIISEKAKLNTMFDAEERNKLAVQYASEHAQEISAVLADPAFNTDANRDQVARLNENFNKEVDTVKAKIASIAKPADEASSTDIVSIAQSLEEEKGVEVIATKSAEEPVTTLAATSSPAATSTPDAASVLDEAKQAFENKDYSKAVDKLKQVDELIKDKE